MPVFVSQNDRGLGAGPCLFDRVEAAQLRRDAEKREELGCGFRGLEPFGDVTDPDGAWPRWSVCSDSGERGGRAHAHVVRIRERIAA
jgi:hypothetical protein